MKIKTTLVLIFLLNTLSLGMILMIFLILTIFSFVVLIKDSYPARAPCVSAYAVFYFPEFESLVVLLSDIMHRGVFISSILDIWHKGLNNRNRAYPYTVTFSSQFLRMFIVWWAAWCISKSMGDTNTGFGRHRWQIQICIFSSEFIGFLFSSIT